MGLCFWSCNQTTILTLEKSSFTSRQESTIGALMSESNVACFQSSRHRALWIHYWWSVNQDFYLAVLRHLWDAIWRKWWEADSSNKRIRLLTEQIILDKIFNLYPPIIPLFTWHFPSQYFSICQTQNHP
jgi:hypothetical protein